MFISLANNTSYGGRLKHNNNKMKLERRKNS